MQIVLFILGVCFGSFANVLIDRLPFGQNVLTGRSRCDYCHKTLRWFELIPIISYLNQQGRCLRCHKKLSIQYPLVELVTGILFVLIGRSVVSITSFYQCIQAAGPFLICLSLLVIVVTDFKYEIISDSMILVGIAGVCMGWFLTNPYIGGNLIPYLLSGIGASVFFFILYLITRGRGMGLGDVKLVFLLGLLTGFPKIVIALYIAFLTGALVGIILMVLGKKKLKSHVPFGPFLIGGTAVALLFGNLILQWWSQLL